MASQSQQLVDANNNSPTSVPKTRTIEVSDAVSEFSQDQPTELRRKSRLRRVNSSNKNLKELAGAAVGRSRRRLSISKDGEVFVPELRQFRPRKRLNSLNPERAEIYAPVFLIGTYVFGIVFRYFIHLLYFYDSKIYHTNSSQKLIFHKQSLKIT